jgi:hypothetical protein
MFQSGSEGRAAQQCAVLTRLLSPLLANIALSALDEHLHKPWQPGGTMSTAYLRSRRPGETDREQSRHRAPGRLNLAGQ